VKPEVIFVQQDDRWVEGEMRMWWKAIIRATRDRQDPSNTGEGRGGRPRYIARIEQEAGGVMHVTTQGAEKGGRRHRYFCPTDAFDRERGITRDPILDAQTYLMRWAHRRFAA